MQKNNKSCLCHLILSVVLAFSANAQASLLSFDPDDIPEYDYSKTDVMVFYGENDNVALANPFQHPAPVMGALVYEIILLYATQMQAYPGLPEEPTHVLDLLFNDINGNIRLGQRLFIGDPWLSDGKSLVLMKPEDFELLANFLRKRYEAGEKNGTEWLENLRRPEKDELPEDWLPEKASLQIAIASMTSDYQRDGYDPGAAIRQPWNNDQNEVSTEPFADRQARQNGSAAEVQATAQDREQHRTTELSEANNVAPQTALQVLPEGIETDEAVSTRKPTNNKDAQQRFLPALLMLLGLLILTVVLHRRRKNFASRAP